ncbi:HYR domain-containing protein, partial [Geojedonia litorea]
MKQHYTYYVLLVIFTFIANLGFTQSNIFESYAILNINGSGNTYYDLQATTGNTDFNGLNLGTFTPTNSLILNGGQNKTYKCDTDDILNGWLNYRIYLTTDTPPGFSSTELFHFNNDGTTLYCGGTSFDQTWQSSGANIDVLNGLPSGTYYLEIYTHADFTYIAGSSTHFANAGGSNYTATFSVDNPPTAICQDLTVQLDASGNASIVASDIDNGSTDDNGIVSWSIDIDTFNCSNLGTPVTVTLTVEDTVGQTDSCTATVTVEDSVNPTITCPGNQTGNVDASCNFTIPDYTGLATASDNCGTATVTQSPIAGTVVTTGTTNITLTVTDGNSNSVNCNFDLVVSDNIAPTLAGCPSNITLNTNDDGGANCEVTVNYTPPTFNDNCDGTGTATLVSGPASGTSLNVSGSPYTVVYSYTDAAGNSVATNCSFTITVVDNTNPTITCPGNQTGNVDASCNFTIPDYTGLATASDNCGTATVTQSPIAGTVVTTGTTNITLTVTDGNSNSVNCNFDLVVSDNINPVISGCPSNILQGTDASGCNAVVNWTAPTAADNCGVTSFTSSHNSGATFPIGT